MIGKEVGKKVDLNTFVGVEGYVGAFGPTVEIYQKGFTTPVEPILHIDRKSAQRLHQFLTKFLLATSRSTKKRKVRRK